jgi:hypothetical protein
MAHHTGIGYHFVHNEKPTIKGGVNETNRDADRPHDFGNAALVECARRGARSVGFVLPKDIKWNENARAGNRSAVLQGDPSRPGPYAMLLTWLPGNMSRPHFHPNDRFFMVISGTWWVGNGDKFDPEATVPMPAGTHVIHWAKGVHYDGAKTEPATILVWGEGPATSTPFVAAEGTEKKQ